MDDLISRQDAIDALEWKWAGKAAIDSIKNLPSAQPERKKGKWIAHPNKEFKEWDVCTSCGIGCKRREYEDGGMTEYNYPFCPNCGAEMRGEQDEVD